MSLPLPHEIARTLDKVIFGNSSSSSFENSSTAEDQLRWYQQGFRFANGDGLLPCGLLQSSGGPCGILAAIQAFLLCELVFGVSAFDASKRNNNDAVTVGESGCGDDLQKLAATTRDAADNALAGALAFAIWQAATVERGSGVAQLVSLSTSELLSPGICTVPLSITSYTSYSELKTGCRNNLNVFHSDSGVMLLLYCLLLSRGVETISKSDMDEPGPLVARFGHCTQELLNLAITGEAVAGVFDGDQGFSSSDDPMTSSSSSSSDVSGFKLRGISRRPVIGLLSHIEAMKYSIVGDYLKTPTMPFWVIASESHLTLLWAADSKANEESPAAPLMRVFKKFESSEGCGFVPSDKIMSLLIDVGINQLEAVQMNLAEKLDPTQSGLVLWSDFWKVIAPLWEQKLKTKQTSSLITANNTENTIMTSGETVRSFPSLPPPPSSSSSSSSSSSKPGVTSIADMREVAQSLFMSMDSDGGGFIRSEAVKDLVVSVLSNVVGFSFNTSGASNSSSSSSSSSAQVMVSDEDISRTVSKLIDRDSIVFLEQFLNELDPYFQRLNTAQQNSYMRNNKTEMLTITSKPNIAESSGGGNNKNEAVSSWGGGSGGGGQTKRYRSDSDVARELQAAFNNDDNSTLSFSSPSSYSNDYPPRSTTPEYGGDVGRNRSSSLSNFTGAMSNLTGNHQSNNKLVRTSDAPDAFMSSSSSSSSSSAFIQPNLSRNIEMYHWNGMFSHSRRPQLTRIILQQRDSGSNQEPENDVMLFGGNDVSLGTTEEQTKRAIELSLAPQLSAAASMTADGRLAPGTALAAKAASAFEGILRTKWQKASILFPDGGVPPSLD
jgi:hypothetical protein